MGEGGKNTYLCICFGSKSNANKKKRTKKILNLSAPNGGKRQKIFAVESMFLSLAFATTWNGVTNWNIMNFFPCTCIGLFSYCNKSSKFAGAFNAHGNGSKSRRFTEYLFFFALRQRFVYSIAFTVTVKSALSRTRGNYFYTFLHIDEHYTNAIENGTLMPCYSWVNCTQRVNARLYYQ